MGVRNLRSREARKMGKNGLNQCLTYIHTFCHCHPFFFLFFVLQMSSQKKFLGRKNTERGHLPPLFSLPPPPNYAYGSKYQSTEIFHSTALRNYTRTGCDFTQAYKYHNFCILITLCRIWSVF
jgi:hypothetical protein